MKIAFRPLIAAMMGAGLAAGAAHGQTMPEFKFSGFGTLGIVHSDERQADFVGTIFQPNGVGFTQPTSGAPDSKLGAQVDAVFNDRWSAVVQLVSQHNYRNNYAPMVEWANVKFQATPELSLRAGRTALPSFLISDTRFVGYAQPWIRPPVEVYGVLPITNNDGLDVTWRKQFGTVTNTVQAYYGRTTAKLESGQAKSSPSWGINDTVQFGDLTLRAAYNANKIDLELSNFNQLMSGYRALTAIPGPIGAQAAGVVQKYSPNDLNLGAFGLAAQYDPGKWFVMTEFVDFRGEGILADSRSWYVAGGYRLGAFTPYASYASTRSDVSAEPGVALPAAAPLNAGLNQTLNNQFNGSQDTISVGVRWDFMKNTSLKLQYDHIDLANGSAGRFADVQPAFQRGGTVNLYSIALDFVF
jgi:hypothetical protein